MELSRQQGKTLLFVVLGNMLLALGVSAFIVPHGFISGGVTGIALILNHLTGLSLDIGIAAANVGLFLLGFAFLGLKFALTTLLSTVLYPSFYAIFSRIPMLQNLTGDTIVGVFYAGLFIGAGIGLVIRVGASTGGMDIPPIILNRKFGLSVPMLIYCCDSMLLLLQFPYSTSDQILYGVMVVMLTSIVMDKIMMLGNKQTQVMIMSPQYEEINEAIQVKLDRGSTMLKTVSGHLRQDQRAVLTVISNRQLAELNRLITAIDPDAFIVISEVNEVKGRGFSLSKHYPQ